MDLREVFDVLSMSALGLFSIFQFYRYLRYSRQTQDMPTARIRSAHQGYVELAGQVSAPDGKPIASPLTKTPCVWWTYSIARRRGNEWEAIENKESHSSFCLTDATGICWVSPIGAEITANLTRTWHGGEDPNEALRKRVSYADAQYEYSESLILQHSRVYVRGDFRTARIEGNQPRDFVGEPKLKDRPFIISAKYEHAVIRDQRKHALQALGLAVFTAGFVVVILLSNGFSF